MSYKISVDYAPSGRAKCKAANCRQLIEKGALRLNFDPMKAKQYESHFCFAGPSSKTACAWNTSNGFGLTGKAPRYNNMKNKGPTSTDECDGFDELFECDQKIVSDAIAGTFSLKSCGASPSIIISASKFPDQEIQISVSGDGLIGIKEKLKQCGLIWYYESKSWLALDDESRTKLLCCLSINSANVVSFPISKTIDELDLNLINDWEEHDYSFGLTLTSSKEGESSSSSSSSSSSKEGKFY